MIDYTDDSEDESPLGDGAADTSRLVTCPYCGAANEVALDPGGGPSQQYVEDCQVCCQPWLVTVTYGQDGDADIVVEAADPE